MKKKKAALEADLEVLSHEKELAAAEAEAEALERSGSRSGHSVTSPKYLPTENKAERTADYVNRYVLKSDFDPGLLPLSL